MCRAIYDNNEHVQFQDKLQQRICNHDKDIERLCNVYYQGFIDSVRELLEVRSQAKKLNVSSTHLVVPTNSMHQNKLVIIDGYTIFLALAYRAVTQKLFKRMGSDQNNHFQYVVVWF